MGNPLVIIFIKKKKKGLPFSEDTGAGECDCRRASDRIRTVLGCTAGSSDPLLTANWQSDTGNLHRHHPRR